MYAELYPAPNVNWYPSAKLPRRGNPSGLLFPERHDVGESLDLACDSFTNYCHEGEPDGASMYIKSEYGPHAADANNMSFFTIGASEALRSIGTAAPWAPAPMAGAAVPRQRDTGGNLIVFVDSASDVMPSDNFGLHHFCVTAYYPGDLQRDVEARKTPAVKGRPSQAGHGLESCSLQKQVSVPHNPRQQLLMVDLFEVDQLGDTFLGRVTVPLADPKLMASTVWPLVLEDGNTNGTLTLSVHAPGGEPMMATLPNQALNASPEALNATRVTAYGKDDTLIATMATAYGKEEALTATRLTAYGRDSMTATLPNHVLPDGSWASGQHAGGCPHQAVASHGRPPHVMPCSQAPATTDAWQRQCPSPDQRPPSPPRPQSPGVARPQSPRPPEQVRLHDLQRPPSLPRHTPQPPAAPLGGHAAAAPHTAVGSGSLPFSPPLPEPAGLCPPPVSSGAGPAWSYVPPPAAPSAGGGGAGCPPPIPAGVGSYTPPPAGSASAAVGSSGFALQPASHSASYAPPATAATGSYAPPPVGSGGHVPPHMPVGSGSQVPAQAALGSGLARPAGVCSATHAQAPAAQSAAMARPSGIGSAYAALAAPSEPCRGRMPSAGSADGLACGRAQHTPVGSGGHVGGQRSPSPAQPSNVQEWLPPPPMLSGQTQAGGSLFGSQASLPTLSSASRGHGSVALHPAVRGYSAPNGGGLPAGGAGTPGAAMMSSGHFSVARGFSAAGAFSPPVPVARGFSGAGASSPPVPGGTPGLRLPPRPQHQPPQFKFY